MRCEAPIVVKPQVLQWRSSQEPRCLRQARWQLAGRQLCDQHTAYARGRAQWIFCRGVRVEAVPVGGKWFCSHCGKGVRVCE